MTYFGFKNEYFSCLCSSACGQDLTKQKNFRTNQQLKRACKFKPEKPRTGFLPQLELLVALVNRTIQILNLDKK